MMENTGSIKPVYCTFDLKHLTKVLKILALILIMTPTTVKSNTAVNRQVNFIPGKLSDIQKRAAEEGKLYLVHFTAEWCMPCQWMEKNTYTDPELANYVNQNYLPYKVDIDDTEGYNYKEQFSILLLPSLLIFNSSGELLDKFEESLSASKMLLILKSYDTPENRKLVKPTFLVEDSEMQDDPFEVVQDQPVRQNPVPAPRDELETLPSEDDYYVAEESKPTQTYTREEPITHNQPPPTKTDYSVNNNDDLPPRPTKIASTNTEDLLPSRGYGVQIGAFSNFTSVKAEARKFETRFDKPVHVYPTQSKGKTIYKIVIGVFASKSKANDYMYFLKSKSINGFVKNLADF